LSGASVEVGLRLLPSFKGDDATEQAASKVSGAEVDTAVAARDTSFIGGVAECFPAQGISGV
jgi:hypothetical protein